MAIKKTIKIICILASLLVASAMMPQAAFASTKIVKDDPTKWIMDHQENTSSTVFQRKAIASNSRFADYQKIYGVDVSMYDYSINWGKVKNAGRKFAIVRVGYRTYGSGTLGSDPYYKSNIKNASDNGIKVGAYMFSQAVNESEARQEARYIVSKLSPYKDLINMPVVMDYEFAGSPGRLGAAYLSKKQATNNVIAFCKIVKAAGYTPMLYANKSFLINHVHADQIAQSYPIWLAHYTYKTDYSGAYCMWQYGARTISGIPVKADSDVWYTTDINQYTNTKSSGYSGIVKNVAASTDRSTSIKITWDKTSGASFYNVYRSSSKDGNYSRIGTASSRSYVDKNLMYGTGYYYKVVAVKGTKEGQYSSAALGHTAYPYNVTVTTPEKTKIYSDADLSTVAGTMAAGKSSSSDYSINDAYHVVYNGVSGYVTGVTAVKYGYANYYSNVRKGPGVLYKKLTTVSKNTMVTVISQKNDTVGRVWYKIKFSKVSGSTSKTYKGYVLAALIRK